MVLTFFVCFSFVGITVNSFCFLAVPFRKNFKEICDPGTTFLQSCNVFSFFVLLCSLNCMNPTTTRVPFFYPHRPLFLSIDKDILCESQRNLMKKGLIKRALCSWGCQLRYLTTVTLHKIFPLFSFTNMYIPRHNFTIFFAFQRHFINRAWFIFVVSLTIVFEWQSAFCLYAKSFIKLLWDPLFYYKRHKVTVTTLPWSIFKRKALH